MLLLGEQAGGVLEISWGPSGSSCLSGESRKVWPEQSQNKHEKTRKGGKKMKETQSKGQNVESLQNTKWVTVE